MSIQRVPSVASALPSDDSTDTAANSLWINPSAARELANSRARDIERETRERRRAKAAREAKPPRKP
jgi:hypothetical protein